MNGIHEVTGSIPVRSTILRSHFRRRLSRRSLAVNLSQPKADPPSRNASLDLASRPSSPLSERFFELGAAFAVGGYGPRGVSCETVFTKRFRCSFQTWCSRRSFDGQQFGSCDCQAPLVIRKSAFRPVSTFAPYRYLAENTDARLPASHLKMKTESQAPEPIL